MDLGRRPDVDGYRIGHKPDAVAVCHETSATEVCAHVLATRWLTRHWASIRTAFALSGRLVAYSEASTRCDEGGRGHVRSRRVVTSRHIHAREWMCSTRMLLAKGGATGMYPRHHYLLNWCNWRMVVGPRSNKGTCNKPDL